MRIPVYVRDDKGQTAACAALNPDLCLGFRLRLRRGGHALRHDRGAREGLAGNARLFVPLRLVEFRHLALHAEFSVLFGLWLVFRFVTAPET